MFKVVRSQEPPASLGERRKYDGDDVYHELDEIFFGKCYLCETKEPHDINVEHFDAHMGDLDKKFDWNNLYLACSRCNNIKGAAYNKLLNCCDCTQDVFRAVKHLPAPTPYAKKVLIEATCADEGVVETAELLDKIFNSEHTVNKRVSGASLRKKVFNQYCLLLDQINIYYARAATDSEKETALERIEVLTRRCAPYSAFTRWRVLEDTKLGPLFDDKFD